MYNNIKNAKDRIKGSDFMIKKIAWDVFKNTGDINTFLEYKQLQEIEKQNEKVKKDGDNKVDWNNNL